MTRRAGAVLAALAVILAVVLGATVPAAAEDDGAVAGLPVEVAVTEVSPRVLGPGEDLELTVRLHNTGDAAVEEPRVLVHLDRSAFISRFSLDRWRNAGPLGPVGASVLELDMPRPVPAGQATSVTLTVPAAAVDLPSRWGSWGARGLAVQVVDRADPGRVRLGLARTFALWFPEQEVTATRVTVLAPVTGPPVDPAGEEWVAALERLTRPGGRLSDLVAATGDHSRVTWVVDPWLVDVADDAGPVAQAWSQALLDGMVDREVQLLPYLDTDLAAVAHAGATGVLETAVHRAESTARLTDLPDGARAALAWPVDPLPDLPTAALAAATGSSALVVGPGQLPPPAVLTYTPTGRATVTTAGQDVPVLVPDERLSAALVTGTVGPLGASDPVGAHTPATAAQDLLAELAVITRERPIDPRHVLITVPRNWSPDVERVDAQLEALVAAPWVRMEPVSALVGASDPEVDRPPLPERHVAGAEVDAAALDTVRSAVERRGQVAQIAEEPDALIGDPELELLAVASTAWRQDPVGRAQAAAGSRRATEALANAVTVQSTAGVNLISTSGGLPVQVTNTLDQPVSVEVALRPSSARLVADDVVAVTIPAGGDAVVQVPVHAVQSGDVEVTVELRTPDGLVLDDSAHFPVRVRAEWETIGTAVIGVLLALGLIAGLVRTVRRGRGRRRAAPQTWSGPDTLSPEEGA